MKIKYLITNPNFCRFINLLLVVSFVFVLMLVFDIGCFFRFFTGIPCPACGLTRAYFSLLRFDFNKAFSYHLLFPIYLPGIVFILFAKRPYFNSKILHNIFLIVFFSVIFIFWFYRTFFSNNVEFHIDISDGIVIELINRFIKF